MASLFFYLRIYLLKDKTLKEMILMESEVIILGLKPYDFEDPKTKNRVQGATVWVLPFEKDLEVNGFVPVKYSLTTEQYRPLLTASLPAKATLELSFNIATNRVKFNNFSGLEPLSLV